MSIFKKNGYLCAQKAMCMQKNHLIIAFLMTVFAINSVCAQDELVLTPSWTAQAQFAGFYVADAMGFYKEAGLNVVIKHPSASNPGINRLKKGESQFVVFHLPSALEAISKGDSLVNVLQYFQQSALMVISRHPLKGFESLDGKRVGGYRTGLSLLPMAVGQKYKLNIEWIPFIEPNNLYISGAIDATLSMSYNEFYQFKMSGQRLSKDQLLYMRDIGYNLPEDGLYVTRAFYRKNKTQVEKFVQASRRGWEWAAAHPKETVDIVMLYVRQNGVSSDTAAQQWMLEECLRLLVNPKTGKRTYRLEPQILDQANRILCEGGILSHPVSYSQITTP